MPKKEKKQYGVMITREAHEALASVPGWRKTALASMAIVQWIAAHGKTLVPSSVPQIDGGA